MYLICRETLSEEINFVFTYNESFDANFSPLETFVFWLSIILQKTSYSKVVTIITLCGIDHKKEPLWN
jgi:hypothetical protein